MKKTFLIFIICSLVSFGIFAATKHFWRGEIMPLDKVCAKWGKDPFDIIKFKNGTEKERSQMTCSLIKNYKTFIGKDRAEIRKTFGDFDGFYFSDMFPAYMIETAKAHGEDSWQIVFMLNKKEAVSDIVVHKNCCDKK